MLDIEGGSVSSEVPLPRWTVPSFHQTPGRYPLGTEAVNLSQLEDLASGLPVASRHPGYWAAYVFFIKRFWDLGLTPQTTTALGRFLRPHELVFACANLMCPDHAELPAILGRNTLAPMLRGKPETIPLDIGYLQNGLGGYGQVYRGAMAALELVLLDDANPKARVDAPMGELGNALADAFAGVLSGTAYARDHLDQMEGAVPRGVVEELAQAACFHHLAAGGEMRELLVSVLMGTAQPARHDHRARAESVRMFLDLAAATSDQPLDEGRFRRLLYWRVDEDASWQPSPAVESTWHRWWLVQHRELVVGALNTIFTHIVRWGLRGGGLIHPLSIGDWGGLVAGEEVPTLGAGSGLVRETGLRRLVDACDEHVRSDGWPMNITAPVREDQLLRAAASGRSPDAPAIAFTSLVLTLRRVSAFLDATGTDLRSWSALVDGGEARVSTSRLIEWLAHRCAAGGTVADAILDLARQYIVRQHLRVARSKLPEDTFRFHDEGQGTLRFVNQGDSNGLESISIRFDALASAVAELGLVTAPLGAAGHGLTDRGQSLLDAARGVS